MLLTRTSRSVRSTRWALQLRSSAAHTHMVRRRTEPEKTLRSTPSGLHRPQIERSETRHDSLSIGRSMSIACSLSNSALESICYSGCHEIAMKLALRLHLQREYRHRSRSFCSDKS